MITILAIDDKQSNLVALSAIFSITFPDARIITALSGREGIDLALTENPDVILLDLVMPDMDGIETCRILKKDEVLKRTPVIMITAIATDSKSRIKALEAGVEAFLSKPVEEAALMAQVSSLIRLKKSEDLVRSENKHLEELVLERTKAFEDSSNAATKLLEELTARIEHCKLLEKDLLNSEIKFHDSEASMRYIVKHDLNALAIFDLDLHYVAVSDRYLRDYNVKEEDLIGIYHYEVFPKIPQRWKDVHQRCLAGVIERNDNDCFEHFDGSISFNKWECRPWFRADGEIGGIIIYSEVTTERRQAEMELIEALEKAETSNKLKTAFMHNISHAIRTPLNGILGFSRLITLPDIGDEEKLEFYSLLQTSSNRLLNTITNYMDISLLTSGNLNLVRKPFKLKNLFQRLYEQYQPLCAKKNLVFNIILPEMSESFTMDSDQEMLEKISSALLDNAVKFTANGSITFGYEMKHDFIEFFVRDTGIGISTEFLPRMFQSFSQEEYMYSRGYDGSGLGLSITKGFLELLGGTIQVESQKGSGSSFIFTIPCKRINNESEMTEASTSKEQQKVNPVVLIAEDDENNLFLMQSILRKFNITSYPAENGKEAVDKCRAHSEISLVLMDLKMPVMDGLEACREIKSFRKTLPVIAVTAFAMRGDEKKALEAGCDSYLSKPVSQKTLIEKLKEFGVLGTVSAQ
ncbi:MAG: response regulator [Bacteroidota bacterium]